VTGKQPKRKVRAGVDESGRTPLHYAANEADVELCHSLLRAGADPNAQDDNGWTPLHFAAQAYSSPVTALLLEASADTQLRDSFGNTPLHKAVFRSRGDGSVIALLRNAGADPNALNNHGVSPVSLARNVANYDLAQFFTDVPE
jgi:ankyrin repeat protein